ncbi:MAG: MlaE family ABC transporter permease [Thiohalomonadales bacterium]
MSENIKNNFLYIYVDKVGRKTVLFIEEFGYIFTTLFESIYWLISGKKKQQRVKLVSIIQEINTIGVNAIPIVSILTFAIGIMLAIQGIETLKTFGAESQVIIGIALSITREFSPLIISILVTGRSGSAITAKIGSMKESQEIDALRVMGINPVRYLVSPIVIAMVLAVPCLVILGDLMGLLGGGVYTAFELNISLYTYMIRTLDVLSVDDIRQGLIKALVFGILIALISCINGFLVTGGAAGVGRATTRSVVLSISAIVVADMLFTFLLNR